MIWRPATNPELSFEISDEGEVLSFSINPKFQTVIDQNADVNTLYEQMIKINEQIEE